jgi:hypothetical protein
LETVMRETVPWLELVMVVGAVVTMVGARNWYALILYVLR